MLTDKEFLDRYRRLRNGLGWLILVGWLVYHYAVLVAERAAAQAAMAKCGDGWEYAKCVASDVTGGIGGGLAMFAAILVSPFAFLLSSYLARFWVDKEKADAKRADLQQQETQRLQFESEQQARAARAQHEMTRSKHAAARMMLVANLGSVNDFLDLLGTVPSDEEALVKQSVGTALRELIAKNTLPEIIALVQEDEAVHLIMGKTIERLHGAAVGSEAVMILEYAYSMRNTSINERAIMA